MKSARSPVLVICSWYTEFLWGAGGREGERRGVLSGAGRFQLPRELKLAGAGGWVRIPSGLVIIFFPSPMEVKNPQDSEVDNEVLGLKYSFVCLLYTWVSSVRRSFCINHFMILSISASLPLSG